MVTDSHDLGIHGIDTFAYDGEGENTWVAGEGEYADVEGWGPLVAAADGTAFDGESVVFAGRVPSITYSDKSLIPTIFTTIILTGGAVTAPIITNIKKTFSYE